MKIGRNDPCTCGSGKKYKQCCLNKSPLSKKKITAQKIQAKDSEDTLMERRFSAAIAQQAFKPISGEKTESLPEHPFQL